MPLRVVFSTDLKCNICSQNRRDRERRIVLNNDNAEKGIKAWDCILQDTLGIAARKMKSKGICALSELRIGNTCVL